MKVIVAKTAGFCWGVKRAMDAVLEASVRNDGRTVQTLGPDALGRARSFTP